MTSESLLSELGRDVHLLLYYRDTRWRCVIANDTRKSAGEDTEPLGALIKALLQWR